MIQQLWVSLPATVGYNRSVIQSVAPNRVSPDGGAITIIGYNFGAGSCNDSTRLSNVQLQVTVVGPGVPVAPFSVALRRYVNTTTALRPCAILTWSPNVITCAAPVGVDASVDVVVTVGGASVTASGAFGYDPPSLTQLTYATSAGQTASQLPSTTGGAVIVVSAVALPPSPWPLTVLVGGSLCTLVARTTSSVSCAVPRGAGAAVPVVLFTLGQAANSSVSMSYAPPYVTSVVEAGAGGRAVDGG